MRNEGRESAIFANRDKKLAKARQQRNLNDKINSPTH